MLNVLLQQYRLYKIMFMLICVCVCKASFSQQKSFEQALAENYAYTKKDTIKLDMLRRIASTYRTLDGKKALLYSDSSLMIAKQLNLPYHIAGAYWGKALSYMYQGQNKNAIVNFEMALNIFNKKLDRRELELKANILKDKGTILNSTGEYDKALELYKKSLDIGYALKDTSIILGSTNCIGVLYMAIADWQTALKYMQKITAILERDSLQNANKNYKVQGVYISSLVNTGNILGILKRYDDAIPPLRKALETAQRWNAGVAYWSAANILTEIYYKMRNYPRSFYFAIPTYQYHLKVNMPEELSMDYKNIARLVRDAPDSLLTKNNIALSRRYDSTINLLNKAIQLADDLNSNALREDLLEEMSITYERIGNYTKAYEYYKKFKIIHDSLGNTSQLQSILINDMQYQFGKQQDSLKFSQELIQTKLQLQVVANRQQAELATKEKEIQHLAFLKTQAELQTEQQEKAEQQKQLNLSEKEKQLQQSQLLSLSQEKELAKFKLKQQWLYSLFGLLFLGLIASFFLYKNRIQRLRLKNALVREKTSQQLKEAELQNKMNDITLTALRSQMNPHFIFNCLNSIKLYTEEKNNEAASEYLSKFSKLIRNMLDSTRSDRVALSAELESIKLYIEMEAMRFKDKLKYSINIDKNVDADYIEVPPLLIQPYIENAIWHGLMHKEKGGRIDVAIHQAMDEEALIIIITDDGIGREASEILKSKSAMKHKSYGTKVTGERIALINEKYKAGANVEIKDLYKNDQAIGTQVTIKLPLE